MFIATSLSFYKRPEIRKLLVEQAQDKEVSVMFGLSKFGKRPDVISYENDVLDLAKKKASSFHCSEELWYNPLSIQTGMKRHELDELRKGWDLVLDVDCPDWDFSRLITHMFIKVLEEHKIKSISVKFSGNKGFHVAVPFEAFPSQVWFEGESRLTKDLFPEGPRKIALYLLRYIEDHFAKISENNVTFLSTHTFNLSQLQAIAKKSSQDLFNFICSECKAPIKSLPNQKVKYVCSSCGHQSKPKGSPDYIRCEQCNAPVKGETKTTFCFACGSQKYPLKKLNLLAIVDVDTVLIASRHLYRMPYSLHEKSGLVSLPIHTSEVLTFDKQRAVPEKIVPSVPFLERTAVTFQEGATLLSEAFSKELQDAGHIYVDVSRNVVTRKKIELPEDAVPEKFFPPCMHNILKGLEDGKKRALFVLINFLRSSGWSADQIEEFIFKWNEKNPEPLREQYITSQLSQIKRGKQILLPPNCANTDYYKSLLICTPDNFCGRIRNPAMYARRKFEQGSTQQKKSVKKKSTAKKRITKKDKKPVSEKKKT